MSKFYVSVCVEVEADTLEEAWEQVNYSVGDELFALDPDYIVGEPEEVRDKEKLNGNGA